jgi:O-antigen ligase
MITAVAPSRIVAPIPRDIRTRSNRTPRSVVIGAILLGIITFVDDAVFRTSDAEKFSFDWQVALRLACCGLCGLYGLVYLRKSYPTLTHGAGLLVLAFGAWAIVTVLFSVSGLYSAAAVTALWCAILFVAAVRVEIPPRWIMGSVVTSLLVFLAASWFVYFFIPGMGREEQDIGGGVIIVRFGGLQHPNGLGSQAALAYAMLLVMGIERFARWRTLVVPLAFAALTAVASDSRTSMLALMVLTVVAILRLQPFAKAAFGLFFVIPFAVALFGFAAATDVLPVNSDRIVSKLSRDGDSSELYSMNSRTVVWDFAIEKIFESPWVGCGYGCQRFIMKDNFFPTHHAHNLVLNVALGTGYIGAILLVCQLGVLVRRFFGGHNPFSSLLIVAVLLEGFAEGQMFGPTPDAHTVLLLLAVLTQTGWSQWSAREAALSPEVACHLN